MAPQVVRSINVAIDKKPIESWIINMNELHTKKGVSQMKYKGRMPDIEALMQVWPSEIERALEQVRHARAYVFFSIVASSHSSQ